MDIEIVINGRAFKITQNNTQEELECGMDTLSACVCALYLETLKLQAKEENKTMSDFLFDDILEEKMRELFLKTFYRTLRNNLKCIVSLNLKRIFEKCGA